MIQVYNSFHPTSIYRTSLDIDNNYKQECIDEIYRLGDSMNHTSNIKALMTTYWVFNESSLFNPLLDSILQEIKICHWASNPEDSFIVRTAWGAVYKENEETIPHSHGNNLLSFVLYLQTDQTSSPITFHTSPEITIFPQINDLLIFKSDIIHSVPPQPKVINNGRVVFAGNIIETVN